MIKRHHKRPSRFRQADGVDPDTLPAEITQLRQQEEQLEEARVGIQEKIWQTRASISRRAQWPIASRRSPN